MIDNTTELLFKKFKIIECLKKDACAAVYLSYHIFLEKKIILKTLDTENLNDKSLFERFKREAKILASLDHSNIIKVLDFGMFEQFFYISFEYFESKNLRRVIKENNLSSEEKKNLTIQLFKGLAEAHHHQIIHRDIKPENVLVNTNRELKIADFGLAIIINDNLVTNQYSIVGTPGYMSPEQINGQILDYRSDLFSAGLLIYELFTGINPLLGKDVNETINNILNYSEDDLILDSLDDETKGMVTQLVRKNPDHRMKSAEEVLRYLNIPSEKLVERPQVARWKGRKYLWVPAAAICFFMIYFFAFRGNGPVKEKITDKVDTILNVTPDVIKQELTDKKIENQPEVKQEEKSLDKEIKNTIKDEIVRSQVPSGNSKTSLITEGTSIKKFGKLNIECLPWGVVYIDSQKIDTTPLKSELVLLEGTHLLSVKHPEYPTYNSNVTIKADMVSSVKVNLEDLVGYLDCKIFPWGEVIINGQSKGHTPFRGPIRLPFGKYNITIKNPNFPEHSQLINIKRGEVFMLKYSFQKQ